MNRLELIQDSQLTAFDMQQVMRLWNQEYPVKLAYNNLKDFEDYCSGLLNATHILIKEYDDVLGWGVKFERDDSRWFAIILSSQLHKQGIGSMLMNHLKEGELKLFGWVIDHNQDIKADGEPYVSPLGFYLKQGFELMPEDRLELPKLSAVKILWTKN